MCREGNLFPVRSFWVHLLAGLFLMGTPVPGVAQEFPPLLKPSSLWPSPDGRWLYVSGRGDGTLTQFQVGSWERVYEWKIGRSSESLAGTERGDLLVGCDPEASEIVVLSLGEMGQVQGKTAVSVSPVPVRCVLYEDDEACWVFVSCLWARRVEVLNARRPGRVGVIEVGFCPRELLVLPDREVLIVADAFGGQLSSYRLFVGQKSDGSYQLYAERLVHYVLPGHNIRGLAIDPIQNSLVLSHMTLSQRTPTDRENVFWGNTMTSQLTFLPLPTLLEPVEKPLEAARTHFIGNAGHGAGDPGSLILDRFGRLFVCLSGIGELGVLSPRTTSMRRVPVGRRPVHVALGPDGRWLYTANAHDESVTVIDACKETVTATLRLRPTRLLSLQEEGERLFYDAKLSLGGWYSCHSCHSDGHTCNLNADTLGDGSYGTPKNIPTLLRTARTGPWGWTGAFHSLDEQLRNSIVSSMQSQQTPDGHLLSALKAYLDSLPEPPRLPEDNHSASQVAEGRRLFERWRCGRCHLPENGFTSEGVHDVGLDDGPGGNRLFNPPSLRGLPYTAPYFHDGRAKTLEEVFTKFRHQVPPKLRKDQVEALVAYLMRL
jgi:YVTN family beta-propeller protein